MKHFLSRFAIALGIVALPLSLAADTQIYNDRLLSILSSNTTLPSQFTQQLYAEQDTKLLPLISSLLTSYAPLLSHQQRAAISIVKTEHSQRLKDFKVSGCAFAGDPNLAFIYNNQNPTFTMSYYNRSGEVKTKTFEASIQSYGLKFELSVRIDCIMFTSPDFSFLDTDKRIKLGTGIDITLATGGGLGLVYAPFLNAPGGILILSLRIGFGGGTSLVTGGYLQAKN